MVTQEVYEHMAEWWKFQRRHECNLFEALFKDLPDSNLIKQAVMKHRKQKDTDNENN